MEDKLTALRKYLVEYTKIMSKQPFRFAYIDAFAGTGYRELREAGMDSGPLFPHLADEEPQGFLAGSARIALEIEPPFTRYIFIEKDESRFKQLQDLKAEFPERADHIVPVNEDCNAHLRHLCLDSPWTEHRAVLFLDPFGMQVEWSTIEAVAQTKAIDAFILFPLGIAVNRLLKKDGNIPDAWRERLDSIFGTSDWYDAFYREKGSPDLFGEEGRKEKVVRFEAISAYYVNRLKTVFAKVADRPRSLTNSKGNPLFHLCFGAGNPKGAPIAVRIAQYILDA